MIGTWMRVCLVGALLVASLVGCEKAPADGPGGSAEGEPAEGDENAPTAEDVEAKTDPSTPSEPLNIEVKPQRLALGAGFTCYLNDASELWCWGWGESYPVPGPAEPLPPTKQDIGVTLTSIDAVHELCGIDVDGTVHCWGKGFYGNLTDPGAGAPPESLQQTKQIAVGTSFVCALNVEGQISCIGESVWGIIGPPDEAHFTAEPRRIDSAPGWAAIDSSALHVCGLTSEGDVYCWGSNSMGELGNGNTKPRSEPSKIDLGNKRAIGVSTYVSRSCAVIEDGTVLCTGTAAMGALGFETNDEHCTEDRVPCATKAVQVLNARSVISLSIGGVHACALTRGSESAFCWGGGRRGQLAIGEKKKWNPWAESLVESLDAIECSSARCCAVVRDGSVVCWGDNPSGATSPGGAKRILAPETVIGGRE